MKIYRDNIAKYETKVSELSKMLSRISLLRLSIFIISGVTLITLFRLKLCTPFFIVSPISIILFALVLKYHSRVAYLKKHISLLKRINRSEILREECNFEEFDSGDKFIDQNNPYTSDLDIFGEHSVFQLINRTTTESGTTLLSEWLSKPATNSEIGDRQEAIKELSQKLDWRQDFQASGMHFKNRKSDYGKLLSWVEEPVVLLKNRRIYIAVAITLPIILLFSFFSFMSNLTSPDRYIYLSLIIVVLLINYLILRKINPLAEKIVENSTKNLNTLRGYRVIISKIGGENFNSKRLNSLQSILIRGRYSAYNEINKLCKILDFSDQRGVKKQPFGGNQFYPLLNYFLLLDIYLIIRTERWRSKNRLFLEQWSSVVSEFEVVNSFAGFSYSNPSYTFPEITEKSNSLHFESLGHPLIDSNRRVCNDFNSEGDGDIVLITGSNMGGKSTFLRSVGVNIVLSLAGAPCCAKSGVVSNVKLYTSLRTQDNLMKGVSSFYAELSRIERMLELIESGENIFFLLDEMFKGTNSEDRHRGGFSLVNQLSGLNRSGIIATHDIELANLSGDKMLVSNYSFNSEIRDGSMLFSYKLQPGICSDFNASNLMERSGIKIISDIAKNKTRFRG